jgi:RHH-type proline utilization regulon transcriptional repressor/proline dehydrogenase/delta 1-pyrroline-5-carboxylate dehydrogenase
MPVQNRAEILNRAADTLHAKRYEFTALICLEVGKSLYEADAEVSEAIDFLRYYPAQMQERYAAQSTQTLPGEDNSYEYRPRGLTLVITPWNFPLGIACGMLAGPLAAGCPVIFKPAEQAVAVARALYDILRSAGVPANVLQFLPGRGEKIGAALAAHPDVHVINFTGSRAVGMSLIESSARVVSGQKHIKRVVAEMGGKNVVRYHDY